MEEKKYIKPLWKVDITATLMATPVGGTARFVRKELNSEMTLRARIINENKKLGRRAYTLAVAGIQNEFIDVTKH